MTASTIFKCDVCLVRREGNGGLPPDWHALHAWGSGRAVRGVTRYFCSLRCLRTWHGWMVKRLEADIEIERAAGGGHWDKIDCVVTPDGEIADVDKGGV